MDDDVEVLAGGVGNAGAVLRVGPHVLRPTSAHTPAIHALLRHVRDHGFTAAPEVVRVEPDGRERLVFIAGDVPLPPYPAWALSDEVLATTAVLLRRFHDVAAGFVPPVESSWSQEMADPNPGLDAVPCHNDVCPENVVYHGGAAVAILDFEFAAPGRRTWDLASLLRMCGPVDEPENAARSGRGHLDAAHRARVAADAYGLDAAGRSELLDALSEQIRSGGQFVRRRMARGEQAFIEMWNNSGGQARYDRRRLWFADQRPRFEAALAPLGQ